MPNLNVGINASKAKSGATDFNRHIDSMGRKVDQFAKTAPKKMKASFASITKHAKTMAIGVTAAFAGLSVGIYKSLNAFSDFDAGLIGIQKTTGLTDLQIQALGSSISHMAIHDVPVATKGLLEIAEAAGQLGVTGTQNNLLFTETMGKMQVASDIIGVEGAKALARLLTVAGESASEVKILGSVIVSLGNQMAASESEIVHMASEIGRGTAAFNVSSAASVAYGAALKAMGAKAEISGSAITRAMIKIEKAIITGGAKFEYLQEVTGMAGDELKRVFAEDSAVVFNAFIKGAHAMSEEGESAITILENFGLKGTETVKGLTPLIKNVEQLEKAFRIANKEVKNATALDIEAIAAKRAFAAQMELTKNAVGSIFVSIGKSLSPAVIKLAGDFRDWVEENEKLIQQDMPGKIKAIADEAKGLADKLGSLIGLFSSLPDSVIGAAGVGIVARVLTGSSTFAAVAAGIALISVELDKLNLGLGSFATDWERLSKTSGNIWDVILGKKHWDTGEEQLDGWFDKVKAKIKELAANRDIEIWAEEQSEGLTELGKAAAGIVEDIRGIVEPSEEVGTATKEATKDVESFYVSLEKAALVGKSAWESLGKSLEEYDKKVKASQAIYDERTEFILSTMPKEEQAIARITLEYEGLSQTLIENADAWGLTEEQVRLLNIEIGERGIEALEEYRSSNEEAVNKVYDLWQHTYEKMADILADFFRTGKFNLRSFADFFLDQLSRIGAAWVMGDQRGGFSFANMFGGGGTQPGSSGIQQGIQGASSAWSLNQAYSAYTTAGGGWGGLGAGAGSYFGMGGAGAPAQATWSSVGGFPTAATPTAGGFSLSSIPIGVWAAAVYAITSFAAGRNVKKGYGRIEGSPDDYATVYQPSGIWSGEDYFNEPLSTYLRGLAGRDEPTATGYQSLAMNEGDWENWFRASLVAAWDPLGITESILGAIGIDLSGIFGYGKSGHRPHAGLTVTGAQWDPLTKGFTYPEEGPYGGREPHPYTDAASEEGLAWVYRQGGSMSPDVAQLLESSLLRITETWDAVFSNMAELMGEKGDEWLSSLDIAFDFRRMGGRVESEAAIRSIVEDWNEDFYRASVPALTEGMGIIWSGVKENFSNVWDVLDERWQGILEDAVGVPPILDPEGNVEEEMAKIEAYLTKAADAKEYFAMLSSVMDEISGVLEFRDFAPSVGAAVIELRDINDEFAALGATLIAAGIDLEKYTDLQVAYNLAIEDWIKKAFVGAISYASTSQGWRAMTPQSTDLVDQYVKQYQHIQELYSAYDGTTASAVELSDALGVLSGLSYDLAAEIQNAIDSIKQSYESTLESMYMETLSKQGEYDYHRSQLEKLYGDLDTATTATEIQRIMEEIRQHSATAFGMLSDEQKKQYYPEYEAFMTNVADIGVKKLEAIGDAMDTANDDLIEKLTPLIADAVAAIKDAAVLNLQAADTQVDAADTQQDAANTPITVNVTMVGGEVG